jgi:SAM-dependent methyltransferase
MARSQEGLAGFYDRKAEHLSADWYAGPAYDLLLRLGRWRDARGVFEFGCGTGVLAERLLDLMPGEASYRGVDLSPLMVAAARTRLDRFGRRARVELWQAQTLPEDLPVIDRFLSTYVFDLMSLEARGSVLLAAKRALAPQGLLCLAGLTPGGPIAWFWERLYRLRPQAVGFCRPQALAATVAASGFRLRHVEKTSRFTLASEVIVAENTTG